MNEHDVPPLHRAHAKERPTSIARRMMVLHLFRPRSCCKADWRPLVVAADRLRSAAALAERWSDIDFEQRCAHGAALWVHYVFRTRVALHSALRGYAPWIFATEDEVKNGTVYSTTPQTLRA